MVRFDTSTNNVTDGGTTGTAITIGNNSNRILIAVIDYGYNKSQSYAPTAVKLHSNSAAFTKLTDKEGDGSSDGHYVSVWYLINPPTGSQNIDVTWGSTTPLTSTISLISLYGVNQTTGISNSTYASAGGSAVATMSVTITPQTSGSWILCVGGGEDGFTSATGTSIYSGTDDGDFTFGAEYVSNPTIGSGNTMSYTGSVLSIVGYAIIAFEVLNAVAPTKTFLLDTALANRNTKTFLLDSVLKKTNIKTFLLDTVTKKTSTKTFLLDCVIIKKSQTKTFLLDCVTKAKNTKTFVVDCVIQSKGNTKAFKIDTVLFKRTTKTLILDTVIEGEKEKGTFSIDCVIKNTTNTNFHFDCVISDSAGESGADWHGEGVTYTKWKIYYRDRFELLFEKSLQKLKVPKVTRKSKLGILSSVKQRGKYTFNLTAEFSKYGELKSGLQTEIEDWHSLQASMEGHVDNIILRATHLEAEVKVLRDLDLEWLLGHPELISKYPNRRLAKLALKLLEDE